MKYNFQTQNEISKRSTKIIDTYFSGRFIIHPTEKLFDLCGIDRVYECRKTGNKLGVEYKCDVLAGQTDNFFFETYVEDHFGWLLTSLCQVLIIHIPDRNKAYWFDFLNVKREVLKLRKEGAIEKSVDNETFKAKGILIPINAIKDVGREFTVQPM